MKSTKENKDNVIKNISCSSAFKNAGEKRY